MNSKLECEVVQDLMPLCLGRAASRASVRMVLEHIRECDECRRHYEALCSGRSGFRRHWRLEPMGDASQRYFRWSLLALNALTALICMVVNFAIDRRLTWSLIVMGAMVCGSLPVLTYVQSVTYRFMKALLCFSVLALLLLGLIQLVLHNLMGVNGVWIWSVALPVTAVWLTVFWTAVLICKWKSLNGFYCLSMVFALCIPAEIATSAIGVAYSGADFSLHPGSAAAFGAAAAVLLVMGVLFESRGRRKDGGS